MSSLSTTFWKACWFKVHALTPDGLSLQTCTMENREATSKLLVVFSNVLAGFSASSYLSRALTSFSNLTGSLQWSDCSKVINML